MTFVWKKLHRHINTRVVYTLLSFMIIAGGTILAVQYAKGNYRLTRQGIFPESGLLSANSFPSGAQVFIDGKLVTATDDTLYLSPGEYDISILKDGYTPWQKRLRIDKELVTQTNALLFPAAPSLTALTFTGVQNLSPSPDGQRLIYYTASASAETRNGLYLVELSGNPLNLQRTPRQIATDDTGFDLAQSEFIWSPDSTQLLLIDQNNDRQVLLELDRRNDLASLPDMSFRSARLLSEWEEEMYLRERQFLSEFPREVISIATQSAVNVYLSPDKTRLVYTATASAILADGLTPPVPATNTQPQERQLQPGGIYVYDIEEDTNFRVGSDGHWQKVSTQSAEAASRFIGYKQLLARDVANRTPLTLAASPSAFTRLQATDSALVTASNFKQYHTPLYTPTFQWHPDSSHLIYTVDNQIRIKSYDNTNDTVIYSGPYASDFVYPWPDGSRLLIQTGFSTGAPENLYAISLR